MLNIRQFIDRQNEIDALWGAAQVRALPQRFQAGLLKQREKLNERGDYSGNVYIRGLGQTFKHPASLASSNDDLIAQANTRAAECGKISTVAGMAAICARFGVELPQARFREDGAACYVAGVMARLKCPLWWRRALRKTMGREVERIGIDLGFVHRRAGCYASDETVSRRKQQKARNRALLESIKAVNENGQEYTLAELSALGVSNPAIRRGELMTRIAGFETLSRSLGHVGEFYTITAPSRFHARMSKTGAINPKYKGETPRAAQSYLCGVWARARAAMHRRGVRVYGFRVAEAHHDGTPHWHLLVFMAPENVAAVRGILSRYALAEDGDEGGATTNRFKAVAIDAKRGTAAGYIAKYISKNIDAHGVDVDLEGNEAKSGAERVDAWASCWGIRQFQQIGGAPVSVWRELRRMEAGATDSAIDRAARAADLGDWAGFLMVMGGAVGKRKDMPVGMWKREAERPGRYGDKGLNVLGVVEAATGEGVKTRVHVWEIKRGAQCAFTYGKLSTLGRGSVAKVTTGSGAESAEGLHGEHLAMGSCLDFEIGPILAPWSPVNNCTEKTKGEIFGGNKTENRGAEGELYPYAPGGFNGEGRASGEIVFRGGGYPGIDRGRSRNFEKSGSAGEGCS
jgi:hypothetical protein